MRQIAQREPSESGGCTAIDAVRGNQPLKDGRPLMDLTVIATRKGKYDRRGTSLKRQTARRPVDDDAAVT